MWKASIAIIGLSLTIIAIMAGGRRRVVVGPALVSRKRSTGAAVITDEVLTGPQIGRAIWLVEKVIKTSTRAAIGKFPSSINLTDLWGYEVFVVRTRKFWISWSDEIWLGTGKGPPDRSDPVHYNMARVQASRWRFGENRPGRPQDHGGHRAR
jgi:hypothetical protein